MENNCFFPKRFAAWRTKKSDFLCFVEVIYKNRYSDYSKLFFFGCLFVFFAFSIFFPFLLLTNTTQESKMQLLLFPD